MLMCGLEIPTLLPAGERHLQESELEKIPLFPETQKKNLIHIPELWVKQGRPERTAGFRAGGCDPGAWSLGFSLIV